MNNRGVHVEGLAVSPAFGNGKRVAGGNNPTPSRSISRSTSFERSVSHCVNIPSPVVSSQSEQDTTKIVEYDCNIRAWEMYHRISGGKKGGLRLSPSEEAMLFDKARSGPAQMESLRYEISSGGVFDMDI